MSLNTMFSENSEILPNEKNHRLYSRNTIRQKRSIYEPQIRKARSSFFITEDQETDDYNLNNQLFTSSPNENNLYEKLFYRNQNPSVDYSYENTVQYGQQNKNSQKQIDFDKFENSQVVFNNLNSKSKYYNPYQNEPNYMLRMDDAQKKMYHQYMSEFRPVFKHLTNERNNLDQKKTKITPNSAKYFFVGGQKPFMSYRPNATSPQNNLRTMYNQKINKLQGKTQYKNKEQTHQMKQNLEGEFETDIGDYGASNDDEYENFPFQNQFEDREIGEFLEDELSQVTTSKFKNRFQYDSYNQNMRSKKDNFTIDYNEFNDLAGKSPFNQNLNFLRNIHLAGALSDKFQQNFNNQDRKHSEKKKSDFDYIDENGDIASNSENNVKSKKVSDNNHSHLLSKAQENLKQIESMDTGPELLHNTNQENNLDNGNYYLQNVAAENTNDEDKNSIYSQNVDNNKLLVKNQQENNSQNTDKNYIEIIKEYTKKAKRENFDKMLENIKVFIGKKNFDQILQSNKKQYTKRNSMTLKHIKELINAINRNYKGNNIITAFRFV